MNHIYRYQLAEPLMDVSYAQIIGVRYGKQFVKKHKLHISQRQLQNAMTQHEQKRLT